MTKPTQREAIILGALTLAQRAGTLAAYDGSDLRRIAGEHYRAALVLAAMLKPRRLQSARKRSLAEQAREQRRFERERKKCHTA
jgi:hypothetical protein